jgi:endonuclease YncB( thermonuclease family)
MSRIASRSFVRRQVASALAGVLALGGVSLASGSGVISDHSAGVSLSGEARVIDGDTIDLQGTRIRLEGIDAPEIAQTCPRTLAGTWSCGEAAAATLRRLVAGRPLTCQRQGHDKYGRVLGICFDGSRDINAEMVREGMAWAFVRYSQTYVREEAEARAARVGIWQGGVAQPAWEFRSERWAGAEDHAPAGCAIKGNVTNKGRIYHMPWSPWYEKVRIEARRGERWFCSEAEALAAGWRPVSVH